MTVYVVLPAKPEHFAYGPYLSLEEAVRDPAARGELVYKGGPGISMASPDGRYAVRKFTDVPTWTYATLNDWWANLYRQGISIRHRDGRPWTEEDWTQKHPDTKYLDGLLWPRRLSGI